MSFVKVASFAISRRIRTCPLHIRWLCSRDDSGDSQNEGAPTRFIPERIKKRLKARGLTEADLEIIHEAKSSKELELQEALDDSVVDKNVNIEFPSDVMKLSADKPAKYFHENKGVDPANTSILLFPGQGSQFVGMGKKLLAYPGVEKLYEKASNILGYDLLNVCINGPQERLNKTVFCQPAVVVTSLAALEKLREDDPMVFDKCVASAGFSVGEYTALVASGMISFEDAIHLIKIRAEVMQKMSERVNGGMLTVVCDYRTKLRVAMVAAREYCSKKCGIEEPVLQVANYLCSDVKAIAGHVEALDFIQKYGREWNIKKTKRLPVSGAFHTNLMNDQSKDFYKFLKAWDQVTVNEPKFKVHSNFDGKPYHGNEVHGYSGVKRVMKKQMYKAVEWEQTMHVLFKRKEEINFPQVFEVGPGKQLGIMLKNTNAKAFEQYKNVEC